jgi:hypothetical protein
MSAAKGKQLRLIILLVLLILAAGGYAGFRLAVTLLKERVMEALGPDSEVRDIRAGRFGVHIEGLRIRGPNGWPAGDTLRAERVTVVPSLRSLFSGQYRIHSITIEQPYLSMLRTKDGRLLLVPSLLAEKGKKEIKPTSASRQTVKIGRITLKDGVIEFFDDTTTRSRRKIRLEQIQAVVQDVETPELSGRSRFEITGVVKGVHGDGRAGLTGWAEIVTKNSSVKANLRSVDLTTFQPYINRAGDAEIQKGTLDLDLQSDIRGNRLKAPGKVTISSLRLAPGRGLWGTFMGMPRNAVLSMLKNKGDKITLSFVLEGDISNPRFSLNETLSKRLTLSMADTLKTGVGGMVRGAGTLGEKGIETATGVVKGVGSTVQKFFGN